MNEHVIAPETEEIPFSRRFTLHEIWAYLNARYPGRPEKPIAIQFHTASQKLR